MCFRSSDPGRSLAQDNIFIYNGRMHEEIGKSEDAARAYKKALEIILARESGK